MQGQEERSVTRCSSAVSSHSPVPSSAPALRQGCDSLCCLEWLGPAPSADPKLPEGCAGKGTQTLPARVAPGSVAVAGVPIPKPEEEVDKGASFFFIFFPSPCCESPTSGTLQDARRGVRRSKQARGARSVAASASWRGVSPARPEWVTATQSNEQERFVFVLACCNGFFAIFARRARLGVALGGFHAVQRPRSHADTVSR